MKIIGVYTITSIIDNKLYIGASSDIKYRLGRHRRNLKNNCHKNNHLQNSYNKYGDSNFKFETLEECDELFMYSQENYWANMLYVHNENYGYNIAPTNPNNKKGAISNETRIKISLANKNKVISEETKEKLRKSNSHLTPTNARSVLRVEDNVEFKSISHAAKELKCHNSTVWKQLNGISKTAKGFTFKYLS